MTHVRSAEEPAKPGSPVSTASQGTVVVSEAGSASAATFVLRGRAALGVDDESNGGQAAPCWPVVAHDGTAYTANAGATANSISSFRVDRSGQLALLQSRATATGLHPTDMALGGSDPLLYNLSDRTGSVQVSTRGRDGLLTTATTIASGLPATITGLAATND